MFWNIIIKKLLVVYLCRNYYVSCHERRGAAIRIVLTRFRFTGEFEEILAVEMLVFLVLVCKQIANKKKVVRIFLFWFFMLFTCLGFSLP